TNPRNPVSLSQCATPTNFRRAFAQLIPSRLVHSTHFFHEALRNFSRHGPAEGTEFSAGNNCLRFHLDDAEHVLRQKIVTQFENDVGVRLVTREAKAELLELRTL